jgi:hypothetical protein
MFAWEANIAPLPTASARLIGCAEGAAVVGTAAVGAIRFVADDARRLAPAIDTGHAGPTRPACLTSLAANSIDDARLAHGQHAAGQVEAAATASSTGPRETFDAAAAVDAMSPGLRGAIAASLPAPSAGEVIEAAVANAIGAAAAEAIWTAFAARARQDGSRTTRHGERAGGARENCFQKCPARPDGKEFGQPIDAKVFH